jgi:hypothetical protein
MNKRSLFYCAVVASAFGCSGAGGTESKGSSWADAGASWGGSSGSYGSGGSASAGDRPVVTADAALPPENEQKLDFLAPQAGARYVYVANPSRNTVSIIDSTNLSVAEVEPGDSPTYVATVPGQDTALVVNTGSHTLAVLIGNTAPDNKRGIPIVAKANTISIAPDKQHAVIWFDSSLVGTGGAGGATGNSGSTTGSTQEVSVIDLAATGANLSITMTVGYNPSAVVFASAADPSAAAAFVVTDDGISELRFASITKSSIAPFTPIGNGTTVSLASDAGATGDGSAASFDGGVATDLRSAIDGTVLDSGPTSPDLAVTPTGTGRAVDVSVTATGAYAIARRDGSAELLLVDLKTRTVSSLLMSSPVTDLDLLPSGTQAFAVLRNESKMVRLEIPGSFTAGVPVTPWQFTNVTVGSVTLSPKGNFAVLYTTAVASKSLVILDVAGEQYRTVDLHQTIRAVAIAPDESSALVLHSDGTTSGAGGSGGSSTKFYGYTMVRLQDGFTKLQQTAAQPNPFAITPDSKFAFVLLRDDAASIRIAQQISLESFATVDYPLGSPPNSIAALASASHKVFVGQVHSQGRISFIDWLTGDVQSVTGFALNGRIQQ